VDRFAAMEAFVRVVETGSFSGAARQLGIGQPAVSKSVAELEDRLGVALVLRSSRGLTLTEAGESFYERAKRSIEEADEAELAARGAGAGLSGRLRFSAAVTFARLHVMPRLPLLLATHPALAIEAILDDRNVDLIGEGVDVGLRMGTLEDSAMTARKIGQSRRMVLGTPAYFAKFGEPATPVELARHRAVVYAQRGGGDTWVFRRVDDEESVMLSHGVRITGAEGVREAVFASLGLCVASEWMFQPELESGRVKQVMNDWLLPPIDLWATFPTGRRANAKAHAFASFVEDQLKLGGGSSSLVQEDRDPPAASTVANPP
jgi:DNA-binding transcriptional LysR family regulator